MTFLPAENCLRMKEIAFQNVSSIMETSPLIFSPTDAVSTLIGSLRSSGSYEALVSYENKMRLVTVRDLLSVPNPERSFLGRIAKSMMPISPKAPVLEAVDLMFTNKTWALLVEENGNAAGTVSQMNVMDAMSGPLRSQEISCGKVMKTPAISVFTNDKLSEARRLMRKHDLCCLPVLDERKILRGLITDKDIVFNLLQPGESTTEGERSGETVRIWNMPVKSLMDENPPTVEQDEPLFNALRKLKNRGKGACVVKEGSTVLGMITPMEVISPILKFKPEEEMRVYIIGLPELGDFQEIATVQDKIFRVLDKAFGFHQGIVEIIVDVKRRKTSGKRILYQVKARIYSPRGLFTLSAQGWYLSKVFDNLCRKLDRRFVNRKPRKRAQTLW